MDTTELYVNGLSTSLPPEVQLAFLRSVPGMEEVRMTKPGYAIEYDYFPPHQLRHTLEVRRIPGLFFAGQINGTTGYEEAAGQGLVAGANAALQVKSREPFVVERDQGYIGVLIDDLVTKGVDEPYRLFTSRAEFRLLLRQDNAPRRLGTLARDVGLLTDTQREALDDRLAEEDRAMAWFSSTNLSPEDARPLLEAAGSAPISRPTRMVELLKRPTLSAQGVVGAAPDSPRFDGDVLTTVEVDVKYAGYVRREVERAERLRQYADFVIPEDVPYQRFTTLSFEARQKLARIRPASLAQASRIPGVSPADLQNLMMEVEATRRSASGLLGGGRQSPRRVDARCPQCREQARRARDQGQNDGGSREGRQVPGGDAEELALEEPRRRGLPGGVRP